jgi:hypothetical protein
MKQSPKLYPIPTACIMNVNENYFSHPGEDIMKRPQNHDL